MSSDRPLAGRAAIVTGSGRRIGREIAEALARAGAAVVVNARSNQQQADEAVAAIEKAGGRAISVLANVSKREDAERLVATTVEKLGRLDILVNNAAVRARREVGEISDAEWREVIGVILDGSFFLTRAAIPHLAKGGRGRIINIGGATAFTGADAHAHVVAAKAGLSGLTRALAVELGPKGITVNMVSPGLVEAPGDDPKRAAERREHYHMDRIALGRPAAPADIGSAVVAVAGDALGYLTGQTVHMNGGFYMA
jgi:3-oxoacyl-[acyl-carrier protein] reductase